MQTGLALQWAISKFLRLEDKEPRDEPRCGAKSYFKAQKPLQYRGIHKNSYPRLNGNDADILLPHGRNVFLNKIRANPRLKILKVGS
jgi:hypothetical protein